MKTLESLSPFLFPTPDSGQTCAVVFACGRVLPGNLGCYVRY